MLGCWFPADPQIAAAGRGDLPVLPVCQKHQNKANKRVEEPTQIHLGAQWDMGLWQREGPSLSPLLEKTVGWVWVNLGIFDFLFCFVFPPGSLLTFYVCVYSNHFLIPSGIVHHTQPEPGRGLGGVPRHTQGRPRGFYMKLGFYLIYFNYFLLGFSCLHRTCLIPVWASGSA